VSDPVTYTAAVPARESTVSFVSSLLETERRRRGTRRGRRALDCRSHAVLVLRCYVRSDHRP
jgi:hypothetical protein